MKVGSLVACMSNWSYDPCDILVGNTHPIKGNTYTVRTIANDGYITLEEIVNPEANYIDGYGELEYNPKRFRELLPPISNIEETINQNTLEYENRN